MDLIPSYGSITNLESSDKGVLMEEFRRQELADRIPLIFALAYLGGEDVREMFISAIEEDYGDRVFEFKEIAVMQSLSLGLGFLSREDEWAFAYLLRRLTPDSWSARKWLDDPQLNAENHLTTFAMTAVGYSGRADAREILEAAAPKDARKIARLGPGIVNAQFALDYIDQHGHDAFFKLSVSRDLHREFAEWRKTDNGEHWRSWRWSAVMAGVE